MMDGSMSPERVPINRPSSGVKPIDVSYDSPFLIAQAEQHPRIGFIGVEPFVNGMAKALAAIEQKTLANIRLHFDDATSLLQWLPAASLACVELIYPDPWPKRRHAKRRLLKPEFVTVLAQKLEPAGVVDIATDAEPYSRQIREVFQAAPQYELVYDQIHHQRESFRPYASDYELMFLNEGKPIYYLKYRRQ